MSRLPMAALALAGALLVVVPTRATAQERAPRASLGVMVDPTPPDAEHAGLVVRQVRPDSPAAKAGMKEGDVITRVAQKDVKDLEGLLNTLAPHKPGDKLDFQVVRDGKEKTLNVTLGQRQPRPRRGGDDFPAARPSAFLGVQTMPLTQAARDRLGIKADRGVVVTDVVPDTPAAKAGLKRGDVITSVNGKDISDPGQLRQAVEDAGVGKTVTIKTERGKETKEFKAELEETPGDVGFSPPRNFPRLPGSPFGSDDRIQRLERQIQDLEKRVRELEQKGGKPAK
ncbi:MAG TPA: PDZ domain-containing protein [Gemmataceae bacterium]|nr:PDZ domain-containing protein [Gemmataceae bacterium]